MNNYRAGIYLRLSKEDGAKESSSIASQRMVIENFASERGYKIVREFSDDGFSGTNFDRPAFNQMIKEVEKGQINMIIVKDLSRLGRDYIMTGKYTEEYFPMMNVRFIAINDSFDSESGESDLAPFRNVINEMYARDISRKIRSSLYAKMKNGEFIGNFPPYGYRKENHRLMLDEESSQIVREIYEEILNGKSLADISIILNNKRVLCPLDYRLQKLGKDINNTKWTAQSIRKIVKNPVYIGRLVQGKTRKPSFKSKKSHLVNIDKLIIYEDAHPPIVAKDVFEIANRVISIRSTSQKRSALSGIITCGHCGKVLRISRQKTLVCENNCLEGARISEDYVLTNINELLVKHKINYLFEDMSLVNKLKSFKTITISFDKQAEIMGFFRQ